MFPMKQSQRGGRWLQVVCHQAENETGDFAVAYWKESEDPRLTGPGSSWVNRASGNWCLTQRDAVREEVWVLRDSAEGPKTEKGPAGGLL